MPETPADWAVKLFRKSVLKQRKLAEIRGLLGDPRGQRCLDLGSDNGVVSLLLRREGGRWASGDLIPETVDSIRSLVETDVHLVKGDALPFADAEFDRVVVVDMLEHVPDDAAFAAELARITKPGGRLIVNTPHLKKTGLRKLRHGLGQTDEKHGHLRPGYTEQDLRRLLEPAFALHGSHTYSRFFSELVDTAINVGVEKVGGKKSSSKGMVVTGSDLAKNRKMFSAYSAVYPVVWAVSRLDALVPATGYMLIASATRR
jgi:2-polyprenyl-3-methyl-5-hydroxy-6-metoxy-1,4-benzoquinol methylase